MDIRLAALVGVDGVTWSSGIHQSHNSPTTPNSIYISKIHNFLLATVTNSCTLISKKQKHLYGNISYLNPMTIRNLIMLTNQPRD